MSISANPEIACMIVAKRYDVGTSCCAPLRYDVKVPVLRSMRLSACGVPTHTVRCDLVNGAYKRFHPAWEREAIA